MIKQYRKKPIVIEAVQYDGLNHAEIRQFCGEAVTITVNDAAWQVGVAAPYAEVSIATPEGVMCVSQFDFIIKGVKGEFYPCKPSIFRQTYEEVQE